ncbi:MAG: dodecin domain-containing protein [Geminicoccaceae bacterium]|nr:dodecin domain-containing protein [Geminicoccaceae bacterium]
MQDDHVYKVMEIVGSSRTGLEDAIQTALVRAGQSIKHLRWFEVKDIRGHVEDGKAAHYQVTLRIGFQVE